MLGGGWDRGRSAGGYAVASRGTSAAEARGLDLSQRYSG